ncbi:MAG TPA: Hsp33 family molecular chaperone HslO [Acholeplasmataceae bacterium]|nr:Hsp33 family molecular chaperone HslO [Acholeplasmataceae bacterium]
MKNYVYIATAYDNTIRIYVANTTNLVKEAAEIHDTWPTATAAFGRFLTVSGMMGLMYKDEERLTLQIKGDGPIEKMLVEANGKGEVRGELNNPHIYIRSEKEGKLDVGQAVGAGFLHVTKDLGMKSSFTSSAELVSGEIAEDFTHFFAISEQTPSAVSLGVLIDKDHSVKHAGGFIIQVLPGASNETIDFLENNLHAVGPVSAWFDEGKSLEDLLSALANNTEKILDKRELQYKCRCSKDGFAKSLSALDKESMDELLKDEQIEIVCNFCKTRYVFTNVDLKEIQKQQLAK